MSARIEWFKTGPRTDLRVDIAGGSLTLGSASALLNAADYGWSPAEVAGGIYKNGTLATALTINGTTGAITAAAVIVAQDDTIEIRVEFTGPWSWPWANRMVARRSAILVVPSGTASFAFNDTSYAQPVPGFDLGFGWDADNTLKVGVKVASADGATQSLTVTTRRLPTAQESSSSLSLSNTSAVQTHISSFTRGDVTGDFEIEWLLPSASGTPRQEDRVRLQFQTKELVASFPPSFPTDNVSLVQSRNSNRLKLGAPGQ